MSREKKLENGVTIAYLDESKKLAGDRWLVKLRYRVSTPMQGWMRDSMSGSDPQTVFCRDLLGEQLVHETTMERNFIDEGKREELLAEMVHGLDETVLPYCSTEGFVRQLFARKLTEATQHFRQQRQPPPPDDDDDPTGPADFSACFR